MKKIILTIFLISNLFLCIDKADISIISTQYALAQNHGNYNPNCPTVNGSGGGGFLSWLGGAINSIGSAISNAASAIANAVADFFSGGGDGETFGSEEPDNNDYGWDPTDNGSWDPPPYDPGNPWDDPNFDDSNWGPQEWDIVDNWGYYYNLYEEASSRPYDNSKYYITVGSTYYRFYNNDTIAVPQSDSTVLVLHNENYPHKVGVNGTAWKEDNSTLNAEAKHCWMMTSAVRTSDVKVQDTILNSPLIRNDFWVYRLPTIVFEKDPATYKGEFGFDDSSHKHPLITGTPKYQSGTVIKTIQGNTYNVPWMSLLDGQSANIKIKKLNLDPKAAKDPAFLVHFTPSSDKIKLNGAASLTFKYNELVSLTNMDISATELNPVDSLHTVGSIYVQTNMGDTIGQLNLSCQKPVEKKVLLVYVNTGTGYRTNVSKQGFLDSLNKFAHNQIFRKWVLDTGNSLNGGDTLDLTQAFITDNALFMNDSRVLSRVDSLYEAHKGKSLALDINSGYASANSNDPNKVHVVFLFNYDLPFVGGSRTDGITASGGYKSVLWASAFRQTIAHEMGHILKLNHVFPEVVNGINRPRYGIPQFTSRNFMDYQIGPDRTEAFYFAQWVDCY